LVPNINEILTTTEVAKILGITPTHVVRLAKSMNLSNREYRKAGAGIHLFTKEAVKKLANRPQRAKE